MRKISAILLMLGLLTTGIMIIPHASAQPNITVSQPKYDGSRYTQTEEIEITVEYTALTNVDVEILDSSSIVKKSWVGEKTNADGIYIAPPYVIPDKWPDDSYLVRFMETGSPVVQDFVWISVRMFDLIVETERRCYLFEEIVNVHYTTQKLKDGSIPVDEDVGIEWRVRYQNDVPPGPPIETVYIPSNPPGEEPNPEGTFAVNLPGSTTPSEQWFELRVWANSSNDKFKDQYWLSNWIWVSELEGTISTDSSIYSPGGVVRVSLDTTVKNCPTMDSYAPNIEIKKIWFEERDKSSGDYEEIDDYKASGLETNQWGDAEYIFTLKENIEDSTWFRVYATISNHKEIDIPISPTTADFLVRTIPVFTLSLNFDKEVYNPGDTVLLTATVSFYEDLNATITYEYEVINDFGYTVDIITKPLNTYEYKIPNDYIGTLTFGVTATTDVQYLAPITKTESKEVVWGRLLVNANKGEYVGGDTITVTYQLVSTKITDPSYFYQVEDSAGTIVAEGIPTEGSFTFDVPDAPSDYYTFSVYANKGGVTISGSDRADYIDDYVISITFDREIYSAGDTMTIHYEISPRRSDIELPDIFRLSFGLVDTGQLLLNGLLAFTPSAPIINHVTTSSEGDITYVIPSGINEGTLPFSIMDSTTRALSTEYITVRGGNPLWWAKLAEIPAFDIILLILIIILFIMLWRMRRGAPARAPKEGSISPEGTAAPPPPPARTAPAMEASAAPSALSVPCKSCGTGIELTTSKRPIEVMCPSCGETQMVY